jgi:alpha-tubulin suppressor-like RCC1 family protein
MKVQQHGFAITDALSCVALAPTWPKGYYRLGVALAAVKKHGEAADNLRKSLALSPDDAAISAALEETEKARGPAGRGYVYTWGAAEAIGRGDAGASGRGGSTMTPKMLEGAMGRQVADVATGLQHTVLVLSSGEVMSWGSNKYGQCGTASKELLIARPTYVAALFGHRAVSVACGGAHTFVISDTGKAFSWGQGACGQLGHGHKNATVALPTHVAALADKQVRGVACGFGHTVVVLVGGECLTCGWNNTGQCGDGGNADVLTPVQVPKLKGLSIQHAAAGGGHTAVVTKSGTLFTFGSGSCGQVLTGGLERKRGL